VLTYAHVANAISIGSSTHQPPGADRLRFPLLEGEPVTVSVARWLSPDR